MDTCRCVVQDLDIEKHFEYKHKNLLVNSYCTVRCASCLPRSWNGKGRPPACLRFTSLASIFCSAD
ncbi:hypothetical protein EV356DRAFT_315938 [Viridothelium virens]|uniref:Uncharacterized protein n=1 Tax=Viridothelium virens TaxID=1048519 RepID=A0A6A6GZL9_VIRVR|nr:hypothetical protein EV356DRAFT_315938 [Viridothelium virens]